MSNAKYQLEIGAEALQALLSEFRAGNVGERSVEKKRLQRHLSELSKRWGERFPGLPEAQFAYSSFKGASRRGVRDKFLKGIIVKLLEGSEDEGKAIVNPACVWGRHARDVARRLGGFRVIGTDINPRFDRLYGRLPWSRTPGNYEFKKDDIFNRQVEPSPAAVVFFGACGSLSDAAIDYAIQTNSPYLICRTCCHDNIGGNTEIVKRLGFLNWAFRFKNFVFAKRRAKAKGDYFSPKYSAEHYPRSEAAKRLTNSDELIQVARNTVNSDLCRSIIDLDRYLHLAEAGYDVWYRAEMFVAQLATNTLGTGAQRHEKVEEE
ncbi:MAG: hypothetical protein ISS79_02275 [Phycisphaerae bacterium]|nr:hypothetical protein [Phycisphaerae bacterium]